MKKDARIPTNLRTLMLLEAMGEFVEGATVADLVSALGLSRQTVHRLCSTLVEEGFLIRDVSNGRYRPGRRARLMGSAVLHSSSSHIARRAILEELAAKIGETINFAIPEDQGMSYKDRVETNWAFRIQMNVGTHVPFHCTASGKVYLASLRKPERKRLVNVMPLEQLTPNTFVQPDALLEEINQIARRGFAIDNEEFMEGMIASSVPIHDAAGRYVASLAFHAPTQRISFEAAVNMVPTLQEGAAKIEAALF